MVLAVLAHVDAGKTTLIEGMLYRSGALRRQGRVDHGDTFLDTDGMERRRGITIYSKQARMPLGEQNVILMDTPGHVDFSSEMERTLSVPDAAILVISATDGIQSHTRTLWHLLRKHNIPTLIFVNKMDLEGSDRAACMQQLQQLSPACMDYLPGARAAFADEAARDEHIASLDERLIERYFEGEMPSDADVAMLIRKRALIPCFFGSALRLRGVDELLGALSRWDLRDPSMTVDAPFGARVYKITRDGDGNRMTWMRVNSGRLRVRDMLAYGGEGSRAVARAEKISRIRLYSGESYQQVDEVTAGEVCAVIGLSATVCGQGLGITPDAPSAMLEPVLTYGIQLPSDRDPMVVLPLLRQLEEEDPMLHLVWHERLQQIQVQVMGEVQLEVLGSQIAERFGFDVTFDEGSILYRETIAATVEGVGHYEPLRHYAEVHLLMESLPRGSGVVFAADCDSAVLDYNWQHQVLCALEERSHVGVLGGFPITDIKITLVSGRSHLKHTEGGDFRQATWRAVRQGLMRAESVLLEPIESIYLELPTPCVGRAMMDLQAMGGTFELQTVEGDAERSLIVGQAPTAELRGYASKVAAYTRGLGKLSCAFGGYAPCHNTEAVLRVLRYDPTHDLDNPCDSVFCAHGAGFSVPWNEVEQHMHLPSYFSVHKDAAEAGTMRQSDGARKSAFIEDRELEALMEREFGPIRRRVYSEKRVVSASKPQPKPMPPAHKRLILDGYNVIFGWDALREVSEASIEKARELLIDAMCNYAAFVDVPVDVVFDAYRVKGGLGEEYQKGRVHVVYTKELETADAYIERLLTEVGRDYSVRVVTSDRLIQVTAVHTGVLRMPVSEFIEELARVREEIAVITENTGK